MRHSLFLRRATNVEDCGLSLLKLANQNGTLVCRVEAGDLHCVTVSCLRLAHLRKLLVPSVVLVTLLNKCLNLGLQGACVILVQADGLVQSRLGTLSITMPVYGIKYTLAFFVFGKSICDEFLRVLVTVAVRHKIA